MKSKPTLSAEANKTSQNKLAIPQFKNAYHISELIVLTGRTNWQLCITRHVKLSGELYTFKLLTLRAREKNYQKTPGKNKLAIPRSKMPILFIN